MLYDSYDRHFYDKDWSEEKKTWYKQYCDNHWIEILMWELTVWLFVKPVDIVRQAIDLKKSAVKGMTSYGTFEWNGKRFDKVMYIERRTNTILKKGYDVDYLNKLLEKAQKNWGKKLNDYEAEAITRAIMHTKEQLLETEEDGK